MMIRSIKKCAICGVPKKILIKCARCLRYVCIVDFYSQHGLCADCEIWYYNEKYKNKIMKYEKLIQ